MPDLKLPGGVTNYYKTIKLNKNSNISYFFVNRATAQSKVGVFFRLIIIYSKFLLKALFGKYHIIHINPSLDYKSFLRDSVFVLISNFLNKKTLVFFRGWQEDYERKIRASRFKSFLFKISYARAQKYIVLSPVFRKKLIEMGVSKKTCFFIETTVADTEYFHEFNLREKFLTYDETIRFLFLSRILISKGVYIAINSFSEFLKKFPDKKVSLTIAGDGPDLLEAKKYVAEHKIPNIVFTGHINGLAKKKVLFESHILLFPSYSEGMPNVILEAMLYGMPVISRTTGAIPDIIKNNVNGFLSNSYAHSDFVELIERLAFDRKKYEEISGINNKMAIEKFTEKRVRERILGIYDTF